MRFESAEYEARLSRAQQMLQAHGLAALLLTSEVDFAYFAGFHTRFWQSPTRPWYLIIPSIGAPIAVIPSIGAPLMRKGFVKDIRTWSAPDLDDDGVSLLQDALEEVAANGDIGLPSTMESYLRMPLSDFGALKKGASYAFRDDANIARDLRLVKSAAEIARIKHACEIADRAFADAPNFLSEGKTLRQVFSDFQQSCLRQGADFVPYLAGGRGRFGYSDVISPADDQRLEKGDIVMLDTGLIRDGYFCDFDRNFANGEVEAAVARAHEKLLEATHAAFSIAKAGVPVHALYSEIARVLGDDLGGGRQGHGLGLYLTEWPSILPNENMILEENMVFTIEPSIVTGSNTLLVHEENIVIGKEQSEFLSTPYQELRII